MHKLNNDRTAAVSTDAYWMPIDNDTPRGVKLMLISKAYGVAQIGIHFASGTFFDYWHPLPKFMKD